MTVMLIPSAGVPITQQTPASTSNANPDPRQGVIAIGPGTSVTTQQALNRYLMRGEHPERILYNAQLNAGGKGGRRVPPGVSVWDFVEDGVDGIGGFADGRYLWPFPMETEGNKLSSKLSDRMQMADYDSFAGHICDEYYNLIAGAKEQIRRPIQSTDPRVKDTLGRFWGNCDRRGTPIFTYLQKPQRQARMHSAGVIFVDREPLGEDATELDDADPTNAPYLTHVPTRNVVDWLLDDDGELVYILYVQPSPDDLFAKWHPIRVWTRDACALFQPRGGTMSGRAPYYDLVEEHPNRLGFIPCVRLYNDPPLDGHFMGKSEMLGVVRLGQTVFNVDSYIHEIIRKAGSPFLAVNVQNTTDYTGDGNGGNGKIVIGLDNVILWDGQGGEPKWIHPDLKSIIQPMIELRLGKKDDAYGMASLRAVVGSIQTKSGFHAEVEFEKTENRVARHAEMMEAAEVRIASIVLAYYGITADDPGELFTISYPQHFNVQDREKLIERAGQLLEMNPGEMATERIWRDLFQGLWPLTSEDDLEEMVQFAIKAGQMQPNAQMQKVVAAAQAAMKVTRPPDPVAAGLASPSAGQADQGG